MGQELFRTCGCGGSSALWSRVSKGKSLILRAQGCRHFRRGQKLAHAISLAYLRRRREWNEGEMVGNVSVVSLCNNLLINEKVKFVY